VAEVMNLYSHYRSEGYEGVIIADTKGIYKYGRSTLKQAYSLKLKPCEDAEAEIIGFEELMHNEDAGNSQLQINMRPGNMLGALICKLPNGVQFKLGSGFTQAQRIDIWKNKASLLGSLVTFKYMHLFAATGVPRGPIFKGFRNKIDK